MATTGTGGTQESETAPLDSKEIQQVAMMPPHEYKGLMQAKVSREAEKIQTQETVEGGRYELDDGTVVNANGEPIKEKDQGEQKKAEPERR